MADRISAARPRESATPSGRRPAAPAASPPLALERKARVSEHNLVRRHAIAQERELRHGDLHNRGIDVVNREVIDRAGVSGERAGAELVRKALQAINQAEAEPGNRSDNDCENDDRDGRGRQLRPIAKMYR